MMQSNSVYVGYARVAIRYPFPVQLGGYRAQRYAQKGNEDLFIRCITFKHDEKFIHMLSADVVGVDHLIIEALMEKLPISSHIFFSATHTHSGPSGTLDTLQPPLEGTEDIFGLPIQYIIESIVNKCLEAITISKKSMQVATLSHCSYTLDNIATNRNNPALEGNNLLTCMKIIREDSSSLLLYNLACHPTILGPDNHILSGDFVSSLNHKLEKKWDLAFFMNANSGDISTRYTKKESTFNEIERFSDAIYNQIQFLKFNAKSPLNHIMFEILPISMITKEGVLTNQNFTFLKMNQFILLGIPGEITSELSNNLLRQFPNVIIASCTNGYFLYLADEDNVNHQYYESEISPFPPDLGESIIQRLSDYLKCNYD